MFSIPTFPKLLLIAVVIGVFWWWNRRNQIRARERADLDREARGGVGRSQSKAGKGAAKIAAAKPIEDMAQCKVCGAYVPAKGATRCGRPDCPF